MAADDPELRALCRVPIPGDWVDLAYPRESDFFHSLTSPEDQVLIGRKLDRDGREGALVALGVRSFWDVYVDGRPTQVSYLSSLRIPPEHQGGFWLWKGLRALLGLMRDGRAPICLSTLVEGNALAQALLVEKARRDWPRFAPQGAALTLALRVGRRYPLRGSVGRPCPREWGRARDGFPVVSELTHPFERRWWLSTDHAMAALRDCRPCRQTVVSRYHLPFGLARALRLPPAGGSLEGAFVGYWCLAPGARPGHFRELLEGLLELARRDGLSWLYLGLLGDDPWLPVALRYPHRLYRSHLYSVHLPESHERGWRPGYLELAHL